MNNIINSEIPYFENNRFFKSSEQAYIHLSTEFPKFVGAMHKHQFIQIVYILSGEAIHTVGNKQIYHEFGRCEKGYIELIRAYVIELIIKLFRDMDKTEALLLTKDKTETVNSAMRYIEDVVRVTKDGCESPTNYPRKLFEIL